MPDIPIVIVCHNNHAYVQNTIEQLARFDKSRNSILVMDNDSRDEDTMNYLDGLENESRIRVLRNERNTAPQIDLEHNRHVYEMLPDYFILTDPDLQFHPGLPHDFVQRLFELSNRLGCYKIGFALDIADHDLMFEGVYFAERSIYEWEKEFWTRPIESEDGYELYHAAIDTTFHLVNKNVENHHFHIRVAGNFTAKHLPWYRENPVLNVYETHKMYAATSDISTTRKLSMSQIERSFIKVEKRGQYFLIRDDPEDRNLSFWRETYTKSEEETFQVFDRFLRKDRVFLDVGAWIGTTCMYAARLSSHVYAIEADEDALRSLREHCRHNCRNVTIIPKVFYHEHETTVAFGINRFLPDAVRNDSMCHIHHEPGGSADTYRVSTLTLPALFREYEINPNEVSLIKVDIEGGEENVLPDLYRAHAEHHIPLLVSFHYSWWENKDLDRFEFLLETQKTEIRQNPFCCILFVPIIKPESDKIDVTEPPYTMPDFHSLLLEHDPKDRLSLIHNQYQLTGGKWDDEYPEQLMSVEFIHENAVVLEIGTNIGRNTLTIACLLRDQSNLVTVECDPVSATIAAHNRDINGFRFMIENAAISGRRMVSRGWDTKFWGSTVHRYHNLLFLKTCFWSKGIVFLKERRFL